MAVARVEARELLTQKAAEAVRASDPAAFLVPSRIVRRVIRAEHELTGLGMNVPHRKSYVIDAEALLQLVERDELGLDLTSEVRSPAILIAQPGDERLAALSLNDLLLRSWSLLFHARIDAALGQAAIQGKLSPNVVRERIDRIGQVEFDEMHDVVRQEQFLLPPEDPLKVYVEAAAVFLELKYFRPHWLPAWFPAIDDADRVEKIFGEDVDIASLLESTRPQGAPESPCEDTASVGHTLPSEAAHTPAASATETSSAASDTASSASGTHYRESLTMSATQFATDGKTNQSARDRLNRKADRMSERGNSVKAAFWRLRAARFAEPHEAAAASDAAYEEIERLATRLQSALNFDDEKAVQWRGVLAGLLANSLDGFWNADKRLLHDLQKVCVDHERSISRVDLIGWFKTFGKQPIRRPLPNQQEVQISKHLVHATKRLPSVRLTGPEREQLANLIHEAAHSAEVRMRERLRPLIQQALDEVGILPANLPEKVAREKIVEELLDAVVRHGFVNMSMLRDTLSRNQLKLPDLAGVGEFVKGDWLLQADRKLSVLLDGVYRRGEFYLRGLQKASSLGFGTRPGRLFTKYVAIPFGGAVIILEGAKHLLDKINGVDHHATAAASESTAATAPTVADAANTAAEATPEAAHWLSWFDFQHHMSSALGGIVVLGVFLTCMMHVKPFRNAVFDLLWRGWQLLRILVVDFPLWVWRVSSLRFLLKSRAAKLFREYVLYPLVLTFVLWLIFPTLGMYQQPEPFWAAIIFLCLAVALNSRAGRDLEELTTERLHDTWRRVQTHIFVALFEAVMGFFKRVVETIERVLYAVDEWLRFRSGENSVTLVFKGILASAWAAVAYVIRFVVNLLVEPQVNPIKHFPVVTVSHKIILPLGLPGGPLSQLILPLAGSPEAANAIAGTTVFLIPGIFGFLVWEFKENWRLYAANRSEEIKPVVVGSHGESMLRLMKPGFHSGTVPKIFRKMRKAERLRDPEKRTRQRLKYHEKLHHAVEEVQHFVDRELVTLLRQSREFADLPLRVGRVRVASNSIRIELHCEGISRHPLRIAFQEQSGWLLAGVIDPGWTSELNEDQQNTLWLALAGFYKMAGVDVIREQLLTCFRDRMPPYDVMERGLVVWPCGEYDHEVRYDLTQRPTLRPRPRAVARQFDMPNLEAGGAIYPESPVQWQDWVRTWQAEQDQRPVRTLFRNEIHFLPNTEATPADKVSSN